MRAHFAEFREILPTHDDAVLDRLLKTPCRAALTEWIARHVNFFSSRGLGEVSWLG